MTQAVVRVQRHGINSAVVVGVALVAVVAGFAVATPQGIPLIGLAAVPVALLVIPRVARAAGLPYGYFSIEVPLALLLLSTLVFRIRDAASLSDNPLDSAAIYRLGCVGAAALLAWTTLLRVPATRERVRLPIPVFAYAVYVAVVFLGAPLSVNLTLTAYRGVELAVGLLVVLSAVRYGGRAAILRLERFLYGFLVFLTCSVWVGVLLFPAEAVFRDVEPFPFQIQGLYPAVSSNGVGETGALLFLWSLGLRVSRRNVGRWNSALIALGAVTLLAAQYRTGYLAVAVALTLLLLTRGRRVLALAAAVGVLATALWSASAITSAAEPYALRGQSREQATALSGRAQYWNKSIPVWRESPLLGNGLLTGTRFEVLAPLGETATSTIHGTWIEALVGTGIVGVALLVFVLLWLWRASLRDLVARDGLVYPALIIAFTTTRSITGPSLEVFGVTALLFLVLAYRLALVEHQGRRDPLRA